MLPVMIAVPSRSRKASTFSSFRRILVGALSYGGAIWLLLCSGCGRTDSHLPTRMNAKACAVEIHVWNVRGQEMPYVLDWLETSDGRRAVGRPTGERVMTDCTVSRYGLRAQHKRGPEISGEFGSDWDSLASRPVVLVNVLVSDQGEWLAGGYDRREKKQVFRNPTIVEGKINNFPRPGGRCWVRMQPIVGVGQDERPVLAQSAEVSDAGAFTSVVPFKGRYLALCYCNGRLERVRIVDVGTGPLDIDWARVDEFPVETGEPR